ncbi:MAG TPA: nucleoside transporter C-terminal domain-containing protein [Phycisphaerae bacterium]|nr:nucleoside transporter C-terminal domain-containing protein [Phycisphaerae bacterium]
MMQARGILGILALLFIAWLLSTDRRRFPFKTVIGGMVLQWLLALLVLKTEPGRAIFDALGSVVAVILIGADQGAAFVFGPLAGSHAAVSWGAIVGIKIMTTIIIVATLSALGYHYGILQRVVAGMAWIMTRALGVSGAESLSGAANVFLGQTEAPLLIRPYLPTMTRSEIMAMMTGGFATVAAGVMAYYVSLLGGNDPERMAQTARHLLTASLMSAPAAFVLAKIMVPEREKPVTGGPTKVTVARDTHSFMDAATSGASEGMKLAINVLAMLIAFVALIAILDYGLTAFGRVSFIAPAVSAMGMKELNLDEILGLVFAPVAWLNGVQSSDCRTFGSLLGKAMATNELIAYMSLGEIIKSGALSERSITIAMYSLCGFANISSIGIQIGGIGALAPERRPDLLHYGPRAMLAGAMACWMTGCIAGVLI